MSIARAFRVFGLTIVFGTVVFAQTVTSTFDKDFGLSGIRTYEFKTEERRPADPLGTDTITEKKIRDALDDELQINGYHPPPEGTQSDFLVSFHIKTEEKSNDIGKPPNYVQGTLIVDFYDAATKKLVWRGIVTGLVGRETVDLKQTEEKAKEAARLLMEQFSRDCFSI